MNARKQPLSILLFSLITLSLVIFVLGASAGSTDRTFLPAIFNGTAGPFTPTEDTELEGGSHTFSEFIIPDGVTVTVLDDVSVQVIGNTDIAGTLSADCIAIALTGEGNVTVTGTVDNTCTGDDADAGDLILYKTGNGEMSVGTETAVANLSSSGNIDVSNDPSIAEWEFDVLPHQRADSPTPPVCSAEADTVVDTVLAGSPVEVAFFGEGADPDGGPVTYEWDFGDSGTASGAEPLHSYTTWGEYTVTLTVTDDDSQTCTATLALVFDDNTNIPTTPGNWQAPTTLVAATDEIVYFNNGAVDPFSEDLTFNWEFGDALTSTLPAPTHTYSLPGTYPITLTVTNESGFGSIATSSIYIYEDTAALYQPQIAQGGTCVGAGAVRFNVVSDEGQAGEGRNGHSIKFRGRGNTWVGPGTNIQAQHGGDGRDRTGSGSVFGGRGGKGGDLQILVNGSLTVCTGATLAAGDGGEGGDATSNTPAPGLAYAKSGDGGRAASRLRLSASQGITFNATAGGSVTLNPGSGGESGWATAIGGDGDDLCNTAKDGADAEARSGDGGEASKTAVVFGNVNGIGNVLVVGGQGGDAGLAEARGGDGGEADCLTTANGGRGGRAEAHGGSGGDAKLRGNTAGMAIDPDAFTAGEGGHAEAYGGDGGHAIANPSADCEDTTATGGNGYKAYAFGGRGGDGRIDGAGGDSFAQGGWGGDADATGGDCPGCGNKGGNATATSGEGGTAYATEGKGTPDGSADAWGGDAGNATATGGKGGDCDQCPGGDGGDGGDATATGNDGGDATGTGTNEGGDGGDADAFGGEGGLGATCDCDKFVQEAGGDGGDGGTATANAGMAGDPPGADGTAGGKGGDGGDGGDGQPPGAGGGGGIGTGTPNDIPDGDPGEPGELCEVIYVIWYIYHSTIPDGPVIPGTIIPLGTYTQTVPVNPTGVVDTYFMSPTDLPPSFPPAEYEKTGALLRFLGGISYDLGQVLPDFPVIGFEARNLMHDCDAPGCIEVQGFSEGEMIGTVQSTQTGPGSVETLVLPPPLDPTQLYDEIHILASDFVIFDHWEIIIVDP